MSTFVFVHGAQHGGWCWHKVIPRLEEQGHDAIAFDLPGHGIDTTPTEDISLDAYVNRTLGVIKNLDEPPILVGHSNAGGVITQTAQERPAAIDTLVYLSAILPRPGSSLMDMGRAEENADSLVGQNMIIDEERGVANIPDDVIQDAFYADCSAEDVALAKSLLRPEPLGPYNVPIKTTADGFGSVPRVYIETLEDNALLPGFQESMYIDRPCWDVFTLETSHSSFFSAPDALVEHLLAVQRRDTPTQ